MVCQPPRERLHLLSIQWPLSPMSSAVISESHCTYQSMRRPTARCNARRSLLLQLGSAWSQLLRGCCVRKLRSNCRKLAETLHAEKPSARTCGEQLRRRGAGGCDCMLRGCGSHIRDIPTAAHERPCTTPRQSESFPVAHSLPRRCTGTSRCSNPAPLFRSPAAVTLCTNITRLTTLANSPAL